MRQPIYTIAYNFPLPATLNYKFFDNFFHRVGRADLFRIEVSRDMFNTLVNVLKAG